MSMSGEVEPRAASPASARSQSPELPISPADEAVRKHISTLRHSIRLQHAQLHRFDDVHELAQVESSTSSPAASTDNHTEGASTAPSSFSAASNVKRSTSLNGTGSHPESPRRGGDSSAPPSAFTAGGKLRNRPTSFDTLHSLAPDSNLPLPIREVDSAEVSGDDSSGVELSHHRRQSSPTRTLSRIPISAVGNARALADEGTSRQIYPSTARDSTSSSISPSTPLNHRLSVMSLPGSSPSKRMSLMASPGGTTKVLADLQTGVFNAKNALENTKAQLRISQRSVAQLTRQTEDLKEGRERLRLENEGLNNVVARKERLLQEVLDRARKAEAEAAALKSQLRSETSAFNTSPTVEDTLSISDCSPSLAVSTKSEREYITLRDSIKHLQDGWKLDTIKLREEMGRREDRLRKEALNVGKKFKVLLTEVNGVDSGKATVRSLRMEDQRLRKELEESFRKEIAALRLQVDASVREGDEANELAKNLALELARLRRLMQSAGAAT